MSNVQIRDYLDTDLKSFENRTDFKPLKALTCVQTSGKALYCLVKCGSEQLSVLWCTTKWCCVVECSAVTYLAVKCVHAGDIMIAPENWGHGVLNIQVIISCMSICLPVLCSVRSASGAAVGIKAIL
jgi:hypothetical protein